MINERFLSEESLQNKFYGIADAIYEETGIEFSKTQFKFKMLPKENGRLSAQGVIHYNGPLRRRAGNFASIKLDLTTNEIIIFNAEKRKVHHPYSDEPSNGIFANCYVFEEVIAEKIRALGERARPRDLYDVVHFYRNKELIENSQTVFNTLVKKCSYKNIPVPNYLSIQQHVKIDELHAQWHNMLAHQLPVLPPIESFWQDLGLFFEWLKSDLRENRTVEPLKIDGEIFRPNRVSNAFSINTAIHKIQFATANRVCIQLFYRGKQRTVEPLYFFRSKTGAELLCGYEREAQEERNYTLSKIQTVAITNLSYQEKISGEYKSKRCA